MLNPIQLEQELKATLTALAVSQGFILSANGEAGNTINWVQRFIDIVSKAVAINVVSHIQTNAEVQTQSGAPDGEHTGIIQ